MLIFFYKWFIYLLSMDEIIKEIGERIKTLRIQNNLTQQELADRLHYKSRSTINKIELGINEIHPTKVFAFANALNTTPEFILGFKQNTTQEQINKILITLHDGTQKKYNCNNTQIDSVIQFIENLEQDE